MPSDELNTKEKPARFYDSLKTRVIGWAGDRLGLWARRAAMLVMLLPDIMLLLGRVMVDRRVPRHLRIKVGIILTYMVSPMDLIPEAVLGPVGLLDDVILIVFALNRVFVYVEEDILLEHWSGSAEQLEILHDLVDITGGILAGRFGEKLSQWFDQPVEGENSGRNSRVEGEITVVSEKSEEKSEEDQVERFRAAGL